MELTARYGLEFNPFLKNSKEILFEGNEYKEGKFRLDYLAKTKGFAAVKQYTGTFHPRTIASTHHHELQHRRLF